MSVGGTSMQSALAVLRFKNSSASQAGVRAARAERVIIAKTMKMPLRFIPIGSEFAAEVEGIDLCAPLDAAAVAAIHAGMDRHAVLVFHDQPLTDEQQIGFTRRLGKIELNTANNVTRLDQRRLSIEMSDI